MAKINWEKLKITNEELVWLKGKVDKILGYSYERTLCQGIIPSLHINGVGEITIDRKTGLSCGWFFQKEPENIVIGNAKMDELSVILQKMNDYRIKKLPKIEKLLSNKTPVISSGGGTKPSKWYKKYIEIMNTIKKTQYRKIRNMV